MSNDAQGAQLKDTSIYVDQQPVTDSVVFDLHLRELVVVHLLGDKMGLMCAASAALTIWRDIWEKQPRSPACTSTASHNNGKTVWDDTRLHIVAEKPLDVLRAGVRPPALPGVFADLRMSSRRRASGPVAGEVVPGGGIPMRSIKNAAC